MAYQVAVLERRCVIERRHREESGRAVARGQWSGSRAAGGMVHVVS